jgi:transcriptional regulator with XRE-family HTH domain
MMKLTEQLKEIGQRLADLRQIQEFTPEAFAQQLNVSISELQEYEKGEKDFSFSFLYNASQCLGVDVVDLMSGQSPTLSTCCLIRKGEGFSVNRREAYQYKHLAFTFRKKYAEPFLVTVEPKEEPIVLHAHEGQEFNYLLKGHIHFYIDSIGYDLQPGDSVYFDSSHPHAMKSLNGESAQFLAVVLHGSDEHHS